MTEDLGLPKRADWPQGPWTNEPDREEFKHAGLDCLLNRSPFGSWCGYVAVVPGHPLHRVGYGEKTPSLDDMSPDSVLEVHGGITYSNECQGKICHEAFPDEPDNVWWFGFDCGHYGDMSPSMPMRGQYRDIAYVRAETQRLAEQLARIGA